MRRLLADVEHPIYITLRAKLIQKMGDFDHGPHRLKWAPDWPVMSSRARVTIRRRAYKRSLLSLDARSCLYFFW